MHAALQQCLSALRVAAAYLTDCVSTNWSITVEALSLSQCAQGECSSALVDVQITQHQMKEEIAKEDGIQSVFCFIHKYGAT